jgi:diguanylate cyclase (GGDEF)-like protein/PAS domain S-box-containing protein
LIKNKINHWIGLSVLLLVLSFFFYKSLLSETPFKGALKSVENLQALQIKLHRDVLQYRNSRIHQYDTLNETLQHVQLANQDLSFTSIPTEHQAIAKAIEDLNISIDHQEDLIEDFKTHYSILQNSLTYYARMSEEIYGSDGQSKNSGLPKETLGRLSTLILQYATEPDHETALRIFPIIDTLNHKPTAEVNTLINHSLMIIERLPEIDTIINTLETLNAEKKITGIKNQIGDVLRAHEENSRIFNSLLYICSLYLIAYIVFLFISLQRNKNTLATANTKLNSEINERTKTERTLYSFVEGNSEVDDDSIYVLLNSLCQSLNVRYAYLTYISDNNETVIAGHIDSGQYKTNVPCDLTNSPCEEVLSKGRLVYNRQLREYFPNWDNSSMSHAESYIGVTILDANKNIKGLLAIAHDEPIENTNLAESIITLAASRAGTELLKQLALLESKRYQDGLELIDHWIARIIASGANTRLFYENICLASQEITSAVLCTVPILNKEDGSYSFVSATGHNADMLVGMEMSVNDGGICAWSMLNKSNLRIDDVSVDIRAKKQLVDQFGVKSALVTPIILNDDAYGAIVVFRNRSAFDNVDEQLLTQFSQSVQMAIMNMHLINDVASEKERAEITLHSIADAVITTNANGDIEYMNHIAEQLTGWTLSEVKNKPVQTVFRILDRDTREPMHNLVEACLEDSTSIKKSMTTLISKNDAEKEIESSMSPILKSGNNPDGAVIVFHDETERRHMEHVIMHQATHDSLTGLTNRNEFDRQLTEHIYDAKNYGRTHALCYLDLDRFKLVNDTSGHAAGDELLKQITTLLHSCIRGGDILGRLGGDEFGLILENCPHNAAETIANKITDEISNHQFIWDDKTFSIGVTIGLVPLTEQTDSASEVMKQADLACYTAKDLGRNRVYVYQNEDTEMIRRQEEMHWATQIEDALDNNRLRLHAQSICPISKDGLGRVHLEILVRLEGADGELIPPNAFIPAAERFNLMGKIDQRIIHDTFNFIASRKGETGDNICYSINLSGNSLNDVNLSQYINTKLDEFKISPDNVCFEITETAAITNLQMAKKLMEDLKSFGCLFALDDFGSGLSSFEYLKNLPVDYLKIDGCFVRDMVNNKVDHAMVAAINQIGHVMDIQTIAEFVENDQIIHKLKILDVDYAQGYAISRPIPLEEVDIDDLSSPTDLDTGCA